MKKILVAIISVVLLFSMTAFAEQNSNFKITSDGEIIAYYGEEWVVVPEKIDGIPVVKIGEQAFFDLVILNAYLTEGVSVIGKSAFEGCNVETVDIPATVSIIGERAFSNCSDLCSVFANFDENIVIGKEAFYGTDYVMFYINCGVNIKELDNKIYEAKGDRNYEISIRHVANEYDEEGNAVCGECGFREQSTMEVLLFEDVSYDAWYYDALQFAYFNKIITGKSETIFDPEAGMTCAEAAKIAASINSIFFEPVSEYVSGPWYKPYVDYCYKYGLIEEHIVFDWDKPVTRGEMAYIFSHCDPFDEWYYDINDVPITDIPDVYDTTPYAYEILELYNKGIAVGDGNMNFFPDANIKRCEAAAIVARIMDWKKRIELPKG